MEVKDNKHEEVVVEENYSQKEENQPQVHCNDFD
jgi:hypothetical protein